MIEAIGFPTPLWLLAGAVGLLALYLGASMVLGAMIREADAHLGRPLERRGGPPTIGTDARIKRLASEASEVLNDPSADVDELAEKVGRLADEHWKEHDRADELALVANGGGSR